MYLWPSGLCNIHSSNKTIAAACSSSYSTIQHATASWLNSNLFYHVGTLYLPHKDRLDFTTTTCILFITMWGTELCCVRAIHGHPSCIFLDSCLHKDFYFYWHRWTFFDAIFDTWSCQYVLNEENMLFNVCPILCKGICCLLKVGPQASWPWRKKKKCKGGCRRQREKHYRLYHHKMSKVTKIE